MRSFKFTTWNIEHADKLVTAMDSPVPATRSRAEDRLDAIRDEIALIAPDILLVSEGPKGEERAGAFFDRVAPDHALIVRGSDSPRDFGTLGQQWLWFLVRKGAPISGALQHLDQWRHATATASDGEHQGGSWSISYPVADPDGRMGFRVTAAHKHYRHPQVLLVEAAGQRFEVIGAHLKSKFNRVSPKGDPYAPDFFDSNPDLVEAIVLARVKLTTEAADIRHYLASRFAAEPNAAVIVAGDLNDGPGKERIERRFLYHDLVGALQGDVFQADQFLNHALFDFDAGARWSYDLGRDRLDPRREPRILLDHIFFTQAMTGADRRGAHGYRARAGGGLVEHEAHHIVAAARPRHAATSDHRAVSMAFDLRESCGASG